MTAALHALCGKIAAGKSTLAARLAASPSTVVLAEDTLVATLYPREIATMADYMARSARVRAAVTPLVRDLLRSGVSVVMDFQANTVASRAWLRTLPEGTGADAVLHWLDVPDAECRARLRARNAAGTHAFRATDDEFDRITAFFVAPSADEGWRIERHVPGGGPAAPAAPGA